MSLDSTAVLVVCTVWRRNPCSLKGSGAERSGPAPVTAAVTRGSGIGLATVNVLMEAMQGELLIADAPGGGADMQLHFRISDRRPAP